MTSFFCYSKIFITFRHNQVQGQGNVYQGQPSHIVSLHRVRYRKTVTTALWVQLALVICYLPQGILERGPSPSLFAVRGFTATLVFLNSSLNPILYCWKIREVRQAAKNTLRGVLFIALNFTIYAPLLLLSQFNAYVIIYTVHSWTILN